MSRSKIYENENYIYEIDTTKWPTVLVDNIEDDNNKNLFLRRKLAVDMYFGGHRHTCKNRPLDFKTIDITYL